MPTRSGVSTLERDRVLIAADWRCELEDCERDLTEYLSSPGVVPKISHIVAASDNGPRADPAMSPEDRNKAGNLMALCDECARFIDSPEGVAAFPASRLRAIKAAHELRHALVRPPATPWTGSLGSIMYLNVARLVVDAAYYQVDVSELNVGLNTPFDDMTISQAARVMLMAERALPLIERSALDLTNWSDLRRGGIGARFIYWRRIYSHVFDRSGKPLPETLIVDQGPHVYLAFRNKRIVQAIRPRFLTSASSREWFSGSASVIAISQLRRLERDRAEMSPIVVAIPSPEARNDFMRLRTRSAFA